MKRFERLLDSAPLALLLILLVSFCTRLMAVLSPHFFIDGDESVVGIMTLHFTQARHIPGMFYGQSYGLSFFETLIALPGQLMFPGNIYAFKLSMLAFFALGVWLFWLYVRKRWNWKVAWVAALMLLLIPGWYLWSMKGRGGYLTAFAAFNLMLWLTASLPEGRRQLIYHCLMIGALINVIALAQALWLASIIPFVFLLVRKAKWWSVIIPVGFLLSMTLIQVSTLEVNETFWRPPVLEVEWNAGLLGTLLTNFELGFSGRYYLYDEISVVGAATWIGWIGVFAFAGVWIGMFTRLIRRFTWFHLFFFLALNASVFQIITNDFQGPRYYMPVFQLLLLGLLYLRVKWSRFMTVPIAVLAIFFIASMFSLASMRPMLHMKSQASFVDEMTDLQNQLISQGVHHTISTDALMQWQIAFTSNEELVSRWKYPTDRWPEYVLSVDRAYMSDEPVALVGFKGDFYFNQLSNENKPLKFTENGMFYFWLNPDHEWMKDAGYSFNEL